jgi:hypothetical protein
MAKNKIHIPVREGMPPSLFVCLSPNVLPHHEDYADPFNVIWLCEQHHTAYHDQKITLFNGKLQWNIEKLIPKGFQGSFPKKKYRTKGTDRLDGWMDGWMDGYIASPSNLTIKRGCAKSVQPA